MADCTVCRKVGLPEIDAALAGGEPLSAVGRRFGLSRFALARHRDSHLAPAVLAAPGDPGSVLEEVRGLLQRLYVLVDRAERKGHSKVMLGAIGELRRTLELVARLLGELSSAPQVQINLVQTPEWREHVARLKRALREFPPEVQLALAAALDEEEES